MANEQLNIWNDSIFGLVFNGREADPKASVRYIDGNSQIVIFTLPNRKGGG